MTNPTPDAAPSPDPRQEVIQSGHMLAPHHLRLYALIIDYLIATVLIKLGLLASQGNHWDLKPIQEESSFGPLIHQAWVFGLLVFRDMAGGRSLGKQLTGIAVRLGSDPAAAASFGGLAVRNLTLVLLPVEAVLVFTDPYCRRLGDRLGGTVVVQTQHDSTLGRRLVLMSSMFMAFMLLSFLLPNWNMRRSAVYQEAERAFLAQPAKSVESVVGAGASRQQVYFALDTTPDGGTATVGFEMKGSLRSATWNVALTLDRGGNRWLVESVTVKPEEDKDKKGK
ncbi:MAG: hypothetical protein OEW12_01770 [Deltaproteobacteria bacterium]|nr:hypothetical protein [Deltaproteobacteria bacterium]